MTILYLGEIVFESHGRVAFQNAKELAQKLHERGYVPKTGGKVGADFTPGERARRSAKQGAKGVDELAGLNP